MKQDKVYYVTAVDNDIADEFDINVVSRPKRNFWLSGHFNINGKDVCIKEVIYSNPATIVIWEDGSKTITKCTGGDTYSPEAGLSMCILKKLVGGATMHDVFEDWSCPKSAETVSRVSLSDVRSKHR